MTLLEAMENRHAVREYTDQEIEKSVKEALEEEINICNQEAGSAIQLITNDQDVFKGLIPHYGGFRGVSNYIALIGKDEESLGEKMGYYGERLALKAQQLGLNTCWVAATYQKKRCKAAVGDGQRLVCVLAVGHGKTQGKTHKSKPMEQLCRVEGEMPEWFRKGMKAAMLAPTALNKQNFLVILENGQVKLKAKQNQYSQIDLGIVKYHFELGAERRL